MRNRFGHMRGNNINGKIMRSRSFIPCGIACALLLAFLAGGLYARPQMQTGPPGRALVQEPNEADVKQMLSIAEYEHEIVKVLIAQGRYDRVLPEMKKIYELRLPDRYEGNVAQSASLIANLLVENKQFALAHEVLEEAQRRVKQNENKASLLKIQAYVYKAEGNLDQALKCLERAVDLEKLRNRY